MALVKTLLTQTDLTDQMNISENLALMRMAGKKRKIKHFKAKDSPEEFFKYEQEIMERI